MFFIQVLQVDFLADFQFTQVYTGLLFLPPDGWGGGAAPQRAARDLPAESLWLGAADDGWRLACSAAQHLGHFEGR